MSDLRMIRGASPSRYGGIHWYEWKPKDEALVGPPEPDLILLHPLPHAGSFFSVIAPYLAAGRTVLAPDYPGYGRSDPLSEIPSIAIYAEAMIDVLRGRDTKGAVDLFGFNAGCLVAAEMSLRYPQEVHRQVQVDVPFFTPVERRKMAGEDSANGGSMAVFSYASEERYPRIVHETLVIATDSSLLEPSREAARSIPGSVLREFPRIHEPVLTNGAAKISKTALEFFGA